MDRITLAKAIDEAAISWMTEFRNIVGGVFEDKRWHGHCAQWFKDRILPLVDEKPTAKAEEKVAESDAGTESARRGPGRPPKYGK